MPLIAPDLAAYESALEPARARFAASPALCGVLAPDVPVLRLHRFLLRFCAWGVAMTEPVEGWIRRAGERCVALGSHKVGRGLIAHARQEAGHDDLFRADVRGLCAAWSDRTGERLDAEALLAETPSAGVRRYRDLHERTIAGDAPFAQVAIEYEIEAVSVLHGPALLGRCADRLGAAVVAGLSFVREHVAADVGHTKHNRALMNALLAERPGSLDALVEGGSSALAAYGEFLGDCWQRALREGPP
jgi:hypothetical protein